MAALTQNRAIAKVIRSPVVRETAGNDMVKVKVSAVQKLSPAFLTAASRSLGCKGLSLGTEFISSPHLVEY